MAINLDKNPNPKESVHSDTEDIPEIKKENNALSSHSDALIAMIGVMYAATLYLLVMLFST